MGYDEACHDDAACEAAEECAQECSCGDVGCVTSCVAASNGPVTQTFFGCYQAKCKSAGMEVKVADHDCSTSGCPAVCECLEANCESYDEACHDDAACEAA